jgi:hypothetical protein
MSFVTTPEKEEPLTNKQIHISFVGLRLPMIAKKLNA